MSEPSSVAQILARRVLLHEAGGRVEPTTLAEAAERVEVRLRGRLVGLVGLTGYTILVVRAVHLARAEVPALASLTVNIPATGAGGGLPGIREFALAAGDGPGAVEAGLTAVLAHLVGLLVTFIGEDLALRLVRDAWPALADDRVQVTGRKERE